MKKIVNILKWTVLVGYLMVTVAFVSVNNSSLVCNGVAVHVVDSVTTQFVSGPEIRKLILRRFPDLVGTHVSRINHDVIEASIEKHPAIRSCQVFSNSSGILNVKIVQHQPIMRVFSGNSSFYLDDNGVKVPVSGRFSSRVMIVNGNIPTDKEDLLKVVRFLVNDPFWNAQVEQIYIQRDNDYVLVPKVGEHLILLGSSERLEEKLDNLMLLYQQLDPREWNNYKTINLKFEGQVICSRNGNL